MSQAYRIVQQGSGVQVVLGNDVSDEDWVAIVVEVIHGLMPGYTVECKKDGLSICVRRSQKVLPKHEKDYRNYVSLFGNEGEEIGKESTFRVDLTGPPAEMPVPWQKIHRVEYLLPEADAARRQRCIGKMLSDYREDQRRAALIEKAVLADEKICGSKLRSVYRARLKNSFNVKFFYSDPDGVASYMHFSHLDVKSLELLIDWQRQWDNEAFVAMILLSEVG